MARSDFDCVIGQDTLDAKTRGGVVVRALASHQCGPGSILGLSVICGLSLLLVLSLLLEVFLRVLRFSPLLKNQHSKFQLDLEVSPISTRVLDTFDT